MRQLLFAQSVMFKNYTEQKYKCNTFVFAPNFHEMNTKI